MIPLLVFQLRRTGRNRQYLVFTVLLPALFTIFFTKVFGGRAGSAAAYQDYAAYYVVSMMAYGALGAALGATIRLAFDRASGWLRQLRVTPVRPSALLATDVVVGALLTLPSLVVVAVVGAVVDSVRLPLGTWVALVAVLWAGSVAFVALGLLVGLLLEERAAGAASGVLGVVLAALGGLWVPVELFPPGMRGVATALPSYWYAELGRDVVAGTGPPVAAVLALAGFAAGFAALAWAVTRWRPMYAVSG
jgi:ABC-2 type transport system permease protein